ncbi:MAG: response regulator [Synergistaceae bacterium]|jgi:signal transduction histidine kinase/DNA-binding response OmpR family regulator|nr:response regulator [Synergistaceae bacterium]
MSFLRELYKKYIFSEHLPFEARVLNMVCVFGLLAVTAATAARIIEGSPPIAMSAMYSMTVSVVLLLYVSNRFNLYRQATWVALIFICDVFFPVVFVTNGGIDSGMAAYFVLCTVIIFLLSNGWACFLLVLANTTISVSCYMVNLYYPSVILPLNTFQRYVDSIQSFVISGLFIGFVTKTLSGMYHAEKKKTDAASRAKGDFLAQMSHEMRTPMNAIIGMTAMGKAASDSARKDYCLGKIGDASAHLLGVINDILDMSKIEANKLDLSPVSFDFERMLQKVVGVITFRVDEKRQDFKVRIDRGIPRTLVGDDQRIAQVITNLLSNAVKFTPDGGSIRLDASLTEDDKDSCVVQIEVADNGIGISPEQQTRLFRSFEQADNTTTRRFGGTGLGLAISKRIVELMGGRIWIETELGKGSTFAFTVRLRRSEEGGHEEFLSPGLNRATMKVLAVDDDPDVIEYFGEIMDRFGVNCAHAKNGEDALAHLRDDGPYDLYFVDWKMPDIDGIELTRRIKAQSDAKCVVIMISAAEWSAIEDDAKAAGVDKFLSKPLFPSAIADCINECLGPAVQEGWSEPAEEVADCFKGYRILLAEDIEINREIALALFEPTGAAFDCAENGKEAVRMFSDSPGKYDLILMDVQMPEMDGYEATRLIRALDIPEAMEIPIVAMTANVFRADVDRCIECGMNDHLGKPINFDEAVRKMRKYLPAKAREPLIMPRLALDGERSGKHGLRA